MNKYHILRRMSNWENIASVNIQLLELVVFQTQDQIKASGYCVCEQEVLLFFMTVVHPYLWELTMSQQVWVQLPLNDTTTAHMVVKGHTQAVKTVAFLIIVALPVCFFQSSGGLSTLIQRKHLILCSFTCSVYLNLQNKGLNKGERRNKASLGVQILAQ